MNVRLLVCLSMAAVLLAQAPRVTATKLVDAGGNRKELLRKINGRWFSEDNREVYPPTGGGIFWVLDSKPGVVQFVHHRPFQLARAESLHLWMTKQAVESVLGEPNRIFGTDGHAHWFYYAEDGTKLEVWFVEDGVLGEAKYFAIGEKSWPVASVERDLGGQDLFKLLAQRAGQRSDQWRAQKQAENRADQAARSEQLRSQVRAAAGGRSARPGMVSVSHVEVPRAIEPDPAKKRIIPAASLDAIAVGMSRDDLLSRLGEPNGRYAISDDEGTRESYTYDLDSGESVVIRLVNGKVAKVR